MLWRISRRIRPFLISTYFRLGRPPEPNLLGDRDIEFSWVSANMPAGHGLALDFGCGTSWMGLLAARKGFNVTAVDLEQRRWSYKHPNMLYVQGDVFKVELKSESFDLIINCSAIEHVGLKDRYGIREPRIDGDLEAMTLLGSLLIPGKKMLLTIPVGQDSVYPQLHRVYGRDRLPKLLAGWEIMKEEYWGKDTDNCWSVCDKDVALDREPLEHYYGLGLFVLQRPETGPECAG